MARLRPHRSEPLARPLLTQALAEMGESRNTIDVLFPPGTVSEVVLVGGAIVEAGTRAEADAFLALPSVSANPDASVQDVARRVRSRRVR